MTLGGVFHLGKPGTITPSVITELKQHGYRLVTTGPGTLQGFDDEFIAEGIDVYRYSKSNQMSKDPGLPEAAFSHRYGKGPDEDPGRLYRRQDPTWHVFCMEPTNRAWLDKHLADLRAVPDNIGVFSDSAGEFCFAQGGNSPVKYPGGEPWSKTDFLRAVAANIADWRAARGGKWIVNGLQHVTVDLYGAGYVGMIENAFNSGRGILPDLAKWVDHCDLVIRAQQAGWTPWVYLKLRNLTPELATKWRRYMVPTMLMLDHGSLLFELAGSEGGPVAYVTKEYMAPVYRPDIGVPIQTGDDIDDYYNVTNSLYQRRFERGIVIVNPHPVAIKGVAPQSGKVVAGVRRRGRLRDQHEVPYE